MDRQVWLDAPGVYKSTGYSQAMKVGDMVFVAGVVGADEKGNIAKGDPEAQAHQLWKNIQKILKQAGADLEDLVQITTYITKAEYGAKILGVRRQYWKRDPQPTATLVVCSGLASPDYLIEANGIAIISKK